LSNEGLTDIILGLAKEVPAKQRIGFLETIDRLSQKQPPVAWDDEILSEIEALKGDIGKRVASIEDGSYYEDHYHEHRYWDYDNELPAMLAAMNLHARLNGSRFDVYENNHPMFCDVADSRPGELAERDLFLSRWRDALSGQSSDRADMLLIEATYLLEGLDGVQSLVRTWGGRVRLLEGKEREIPAGQDASHGGKNRCSL